MTDPALQRQFQSRRERMLARADATPILLIALGILVFNLWDRWLDSAGANAALAIRLATSAALLPLYFLLRQRLLQGAAARWIHSSVFLIGMAGVALALIQLRDGFLWGQAALLMFPLALGFYPFTSTWYLAVGLIGMAEVLLIGMLAGVAPDPLINFAMNYTITLWIGLSAIHVLRRQQFKLFMLEQKHANDARTDALTGVTNRRFLEEIGRRQIQASQRLQRPLAALMFDLDHFKRINDEFGHDSGDQALRLAARTLQRTLRSVDFLGRWGGEEFVALLPDTDAVDAQKAATRCLEAIRAIEFRPRARSVPLRCSIGIASLCEGENLENLLHRVDQAMYAAKQGGRDQACSAE